MHAHMRAFIHMRHTVWMQVRADNDLHAVAGLVPVVCRPQVLSSVGLSVCLSVPHMCMRMYHSIL